ncbi:hypothetical protein FQN54_008382 [Arachnomyces sp. PD_36]|nr:hypothetical protein FQN54_008382 [Arachnomyces sp. PD_36]
MSRLSDLPTNAKDSMYFNKGRGGLSVQNGHGDTNNFHAKFLSVGTVGPDIPVEDSQNEEDYAAQFLRALSVRNPRFDGDDIESQKGDVIPHTYEWLLDDAIFQKWKAAQASQILLIKGLAGVGKTMMMLGLIRELPQQLSRSAAPDIMAYFFCQATNADRNSTVSILKGLIFMLVEQQNSLIHGIMKKYGKDLSEILNGPDILDELGGIIADLTQDSSVGTVYLIIDALDECSDSELLFKVMKSVHRGQSSKAKWLVTSRPVLSLDSLKIDFKIDFKDRSNEIFNSIGVYVDSKVSELARIKILTEEESQQIKDFLKDNSNGTFLWIAIVLREIGLSEPLKIKCELQQLLHSFPADLEKLYKRMAKQIEGSYKNRLLSAMIYAQRPLNLTELAIFTDLDEKIKTKEDFKLLRSQVDHCGSLLIERGETVHLIHQTVKDYFTRSKSPSLWLGDSRNAQAYFATQCLSLMSRHLSANLFCSPNRDIDPSDEIVNTSSPLFQCIKYACVYWVDHLELAGPESYSCVGLCHGGRVHQFMRQNFLHWLEAMAYLGEIPKAKQMISKLLLLVEVCLLSPSHDIPTKLSSFSRKVQVGARRADCVVYYCYDGCYRPPTGHSAYY